MSIPIIVAVSAGFLYLSLMIWIAISRVPLPPPKPKPGPPFRCPGCGSERIELLTSGLWDGDGGTYGSFESGLCKQCGGRCARYNEDASFVPTDEDWKHLGPKT